MSRRSDSRRSARPSVAATDDSLGRHRHRQLGARRDDRSRGMRSSRRRPGSAEPGAGE
jgi:hypothetical protein